MKGRVFRVWVEVEEVNEAEDSYDNVDVPHGPLAEFVSREEALNFVDALHKREGHK